MNRFWILLSVIAVPAMLSAANETIKGTEITYSEYLSHMSRILPEIKSNEINLLSAKNDLLSSKGAGNVALTSTGSYSSTKQYADTTGYDGRLDSSNYSIGASKKIISTGTLVETDLSYNRYNYSSASESYLYHKPSATIKVTQPLLYNFLGTVDKYSENNAKMKIEIQKIQLSENNKSTLNAYKKLYFQWEMYRRILKNCSESIENAHKQSEQVKANVQAGLAQEYSYRETVTSLLKYKKNYEEYLASLKTVEKQMEVYFGNIKSSPNPKDYDAFLSEALTSSYSIVNFKNTESSKIIDLSVKNYQYSQGVYEHELLPQFDVYGELTGLSKSDTFANSTSNTDKDYSLGFSFSYKLGNDEAKASLEKIKIQLQSLKYEYESTSNSFRKTLSSNQEGATGYKTLIKNKDEILDNLNLQLAAQKKRYYQGRLAISDVITTENDISTGKTEKLNLEYSLIANYIDYCDLVK